MKKNNHDTMKYKLSIDIEAKNKESMDITCKEYRMKYGPFLNLLLKCFLRMPNEIKNEFINFCELKCREIDKSLEVSGDIEKKKLENEKNGYLEIARIINNGIRVKNEEELKMKKINIKDGYLVIPSDWIVLNEDVAGDCKYAGVVECRNHIKFDIPHFIFFTNLSCERDYDIDKINHKCCDLWPRFKDILAQQVKPIIDDNKKSKLLNFEEYLQSPQIGYFQIEEVCSDRGDTDNIPYGAMIVRDITEDLDDR